MEGLMQIPKTKTMLLDDHDVLVTGASGHIGSKIVRSVLNASGRVIMAGRTANKLFWLKKELEEEGYAFTRIRVEAFDIRNADEITKSIKTISKLDCIINCAMAGTADPVHLVGPSAFLSPWVSSVVGPFTLMREAHELLLESPNPSVVNISTMYASIAPDFSIYKKTGLDSPVTYGPAKAGMEQLTRYMASYWGRQKIRVNCIAPGPIPSLEVQQKHPEFIERLANKTALQRIGRPEEVADTAVFLASHWASYITGAIIPVDGGWSAY